MHLLEEYLRLERVSISDRIVLADYPVLPGWNGKLSPAELASVPEHVLQSWLTKAGFASQVEKASLLPRDLFLTLYGDLIPEEVFALQALQGSPVLDTIQTYLDDFLTAASDEAQKSKFLDVVHKAHKKYMERDLGYRNHLKTPSRVIIDAVRRLDVLKELMFLSKFVGKVFNDAAVGTFGVVFTMFTTICFRIVVLSDPRVDEEVRKMAQQDEVNEMLMELGLPMVAG